jgi:hypothetical protein
MQFERTLNVLPVNRLESGAALAFRTGILLPVLIDDPWDPVLIRERRETSHGWRDDGNNDLQIEGIKNV